MTASHRSYGHRATPTSLLSTTCSLALVITLCVLSTLPCLTQATALTTYLQANEKSCFYADVDSVGEKVGFYFSVQSGGSFDIDYTVSDPNERVLLEGKSERQGDYIFTANSVGEFAFCFENEASMTAKLVDLE